MRIIIHGPLAGYGPDGAIHSWAPDSEVEVDDKDSKAVAWARGWADTPHATLLDDAPAKEPAGPSEPSLADLRAQAEARGLPTYGSKAQLQERLAAE